MRHSKFLSVALAGTLALSSLSTSFAATSDIPANHWAKASIDVLVDKGIMNLYEGEKFNPNAPATQLEAVVTLYRVADKYGLVNKADVLKWSLHYEKELASYGIPKTLATYGSDVYMAMAYAIEMGIVTPVEAKAFVSKGQLSQINKVTMSVFTGRALNVYKKDKLNPMVTLNYKDANAIPLSAMRYVDFLVENKILSSKGDSNGNFAPQSPLTRAILASFIKGYVDVMDKLAPTLEVKKEDPKVEEPKTENPVEKPAEKPADKPADSSANTQVERTVSGKILKYTGGTKITVKTDLGEEQVDLDQVPIVFNGVEVGLSALANDVTIRVKIKNDLPYEASVDKVFDKLEGTFSSIGALVAATPSFKPLRVELSNKTFENKRLYEDALVYIDGSISTVDKLKKGDRLEVYFDGHTAKVITAYSADFETPAILLKDYDVTKKGMVSIVTEKGFLHNFPAAENVVLINKEAGFAKDAIVKVKFKNGQITKMENIGKKEMILGMVSEIHIKERPELTLTVNGNSLKLALSNKVTYLDEQGKKQLSIYDLRLNQPITVYKGLGGVYKIQLGQVRDVKKDESLYTVTQIFVNQGLMTVLDKEGRSKTVVVKTETGIKLSDYKIGDTLIIEGTFLTNELIEALKISIKK